MISEKLKKVFDLAVDIVFAVILVFITLGIAVGTIQLFTSVWGLISSKGITGQYIGLIADVLTLYVLVELSRSLVEYFNTHKFQLKYIVDAAIIFVIREVLISLFKHEIDSELLYALSVFLFVLGALRVSSVFLDHREKHIAEMKNN